MKQILIACSMLEDEIHQVYREIDCQIPVVWVERGFHNTPERLKEELQKLIEEHQDCDQILLTFGLCGNGTDGIVSEKATLVMPKFDDCINMLLCSGKRVSRGLAKTGSIYMTRGWIQDSQAILAQYEQNVENYGEEMAQEIMEMMYEHYDTLSVIDTKSYDLAPVMEYAKKAGALLELTPQTAPGSTNIIKQLLTGNWEENFIICQPGSPVEQSLFEFKA